MDINNIHSAERLISLLGKLERAKELTHSNTEEVMFGVRTKNTRGSHVLWLCDPETVSIMQEAIETRIAQVRSEIEEL